MSRYIKIIAIFVTLASLLSCDKGYEIKIDSFICDYSVVSTIKLEQVDNNCLRLFFVREDFCDNERNPTDFKSLASKHNDIKYNGKLRRIGLHPFYFTAANVDFVSLNMTSKGINSLPTTPTDFLSNVVKVLSVSCYNYISKGYKSQGTDFKNTSLEWQQYLFKQSGLVQSYYPKVRLEDLLTPIDKPIGEITSKDLALIGLFSRNRDNVRIGVEIPLCYLYFTSPPDSPGDYDITVEMIGDNGKTYSATTTMRFE